MNKKVIIISSTPRKNGNSQILCEEFARGARENGNEVELISLRENKIDYCIACYACRNTKKCFQNDGMNEILEKMINADVLVFATPIYYYDVAGQLKTFIDRTLPRYTEIKNKDFYFLATCADDRREAITGALNTIQGFLDCVSNVKIKGVIYGTGVYTPGEVKNSDYLKEAYEMGKNI